MKIKIRTDCGNHIQLYETKNGSKTEMTGLQLTRSRSAADLKSLPTIWDFILSSEVAYQISIGCDI